MSSIVTLTPFSDKEIEKQSKILSIMFYDIPVEKLILMMEAINVLIKTSIWPQINKKINGYYQKVPLLKEQGVLYAARGYQLGIGLHDSLYAFYPVNGKITIYGKIMKALVRSSKLCKRLDINWDDKKEESVCIMKRKGDTHESITRFSKLQAMQAGLWKEKPNPKSQSPWDKYPIDMCGYKAFSRNCDNTFGDVFFGIAIKELAEESNIDNITKEDEKLILEEKEIENALNQEAQLLTLEQTNFAMQNEDKEIETSIVPNKEKFELGIEKND